MTLIGSILLILLRLYVLILIFRLIVEMVQMYSRSFQPPSWFVQLAERLFRLTDPPVRLLRRAIPPLRMGNGMALDVSVLVLFFILMFLQFLVQLIFFSGAAM